MQIASEGDQELIFCLGKALVLSDQLPLLHTWYFLEHDGRE